MAVEKTILAKGSRGHHTFYLKVTETSIDIASNQSILSYDFWLVDDNNWFWESQGTMVSYSITIGTHSYSGSIPHHTTVTTNVTSGSGITETHSSDGTLSINIGFSVTDTSGISYMPGNASQSGMLTLTAIPRAGEISVSNYTIANTTGPISIKITSKADYYYKWRWRAGNSWSGITWTEAGRINTTTKTVTISNTALLAKIPTSPTGTLTVQLQTYTANYAATVGDPVTDTATITIDLSKIKPTLTSNDITIKSGGLGGQAIAGYSVMQVTGINASGGSGASTVTVTATATNGTMALATLGPSASISNKSVYTDKLPASKNNSTVQITLTATDSRGAQTTSVSSEMDVYGYAKPTVSLKAYRVKTNSTPPEKDGAGGWFYVEKATATPNSSITGNTLSVQRTYVIDGGSAQSFQQGQFYQLNVNKSATVTITASDTVGGSATAKVVIGNAKYPIIFRDNGSGITGVGIGTFPEAGQLVSELPVVIHGQAGNTPLKTRGIQGATATGEDGDLYINIKGDGVTYFGTNGGGNISADGKTYSGRSINATYEDWTETDPDNNSIYYLPFGNGYADNTTNRGLLSNADVKLQLRKGSISAYGYSGLILGNGTDQGTEGNKWGFVNMYPLNGDFYGRIRTAETLTANRTVYIPDNSGTLLTDTRTSITGANVLSRTSGLNISSRQAVLIANGEIVIVYLALTGNMSLVVGDNAFVGALNATNIPLPKYGVHDMTYYGSTIFAGYISTDGSINVRTLAAATNITTDVIGLTFIYLKA